jgi:hypothetical protein
MPEEPPIHGPLVPSLLSVRHPHDPGHPLVVSRVKEFAWNYGAIKWMGRKGLVKFP